MGEFIAQAGAEQHTDPSLDLIEEVTQRFSMEWAIRPFLNASPDDVLNRMGAWAQHDSYHVRRLVSEGTRPRLPWGMGVGLNMRDALPLLDQLHADTTRYVTRSVANHLNDISKKDPDLVLDRLTVWQKEGRQDAKELEWMTGHALRGLIKSGHPGALKLLGYDPDASVSTRVEIHDQTPRIGEAVSFAVNLSGDVGTKVLVDYRIHFHRPGGKTSVKVFKLKQGVIGRADLTLEKRHKLKGDATTFRLIPGAHVLDVMVNGRVADSVEFVLIE